MCNYNVLRGTFYEMMRCDYDSVGVKNRPINTAKLFYVEQFCLYRPHAYNGVAEKKAKDGQKRPSGMEVFKNTIYSMFVYSVDRWCLQRF